MYFTVDKSRAFEAFMQGNPGFYRFGSGDCAVQTAAIHMAPVTVNLIRTNTMTAKKTVKHMRQNNAKEP